ncbi:hypothetical protein [Cryobacterium sp. TMT3-29-2]|uniref:hypothetical protein n=1 Tax=Cryobacterium sp. TMT3-29-2 TaxID=2555867 RepID=UPI0010742767|nr:hypothetical protein [Cryobacterium sp. TMT3-29-2]TFC85407.1 hypothetical protein E3O67_11805 [Cryobacterium sp. TMT3-29-2]
MSRKFVVVTGAVVSLLIFGVTGPVNAAEDSGAAIADSDHGWYAVSPATGEVFVPGETDIWAPPESEPGTVSPMLLDPADWWECHNNNNSSWVIVDYPYWWDGNKKTMKLECGVSESYGWFHIRDGHMDQWKARITQATPGANTDPWDDLMWWGATGALDYPFNSSGPTNGKLCVTTQIDMYNRSTQQYVYTFYPTYSWSLTNDRLITGYPSTNPGC